MLRRVHKEHAYYWGLRLAVLSMLVAAFAFAICTIAVAETATKEKVVAAIPKLEKLAKETIANGGVPGLAIAIVYKDEVVYLGGFGLREAGKPDTVDANTVFQLASLSKPISSQSLQRLSAMARLDGTRASPISIPRSNCRMPIQRSRLPSAISSPIAAACRETPAMIWRA